MGGLTICGVSAFLHCAQDQLTACTGTYVEETLMQRFGALIAFVRAAEATSQGAGDGRSEAAGSLAASAAPVLRDFSGRWMGEIEALSKCASPQLPGDMQLCLLCSSRGVDARPLVRQGSSQGLPQQRVRP